MSITIIDAPSQFRTRSAETWWLDARNKTGGVSISGREQIVASPSAVWRASITFPVINPERGGPKQWNALLASLRGRARGIRMYPSLGGLADLYGRLGAVSPPRGYPGIAHGDDAFFSDDSGYEVSAPVFSTGGSASGGASSLTIDMGIYLEGLTDGDWLGIGGHLHIVTSAVGNGDGTMAIGFEPPLREAVSSGAAVTSNPTVVMRLVSDDQGKAERRGNAPPISSPSIELIELPEQV